MIPNRKPYGTSKLPPNDIWWVRSSSDGPMNFSGLSLSAACRTKSWSLAETGFDGGVLPAKASGLIKRESEYAIWKFAVLIPRKGLATLSTSFICSPL